MEPSRSRAESKTVCALVPRDPVKILLDEDVPAQVLDALRQVLPDHKVDHVHTIKWSGKKDKPLLADASARGYQVFITNDSNQLNDVDESRAIRDSGMHHVRYETSPGKDGLALAMASVLAAAVPCLAELEAAGTQRLVHIKGLTAHRRTARYSVVDPLAAPPRYWPRGGAAPRRPRVT